MFAVLTTTCFPLVKTLNTISSALVAPMIVAIGILVLMLRIHSNVSCQIQFTRFSVSIVLSAKFMYRTNEFATAPTHISYPFIAHVRNATRSCRKGGKENEKQQFS